MPSGNAGGQGTSAKISPALPPTDPGIALLEAMTGESGRLAADASGNIVLVNFKVHPVRVAALVATEGNLLVYPAPERKLLGLCSVLGLLLSRTRDLRVLLRLLSCSAILRALVQGSISKAPRPGPHLTCRAASRRRQGLPLSKSSWAYETVTLVGPPRQIADLPRGFSLLQLGGVSWFWVESRRSRARLAGPIPALRRIHEKHLDGLSILTRQGDVTRHTPEESEPLSNGS